MCNQPGITTSWRPNQEKHIDNNINFKRTFLGATLNQKKNPTNPTPQTPHHPTPQPLNNGGYVSHQAIKYKRVIGRRDNDLRRHAATSGRSNRKYRDIRGVDTDLK